MYLDACLLPNRRLHVSPDVVANIATLAVVWRRNKGVSQAKVQHRLRDTARASNRRVSFCSLSTFPVLYRRIFAKVGD